MINYIYNNKYFGFIRNYFIFFCVKNSLNIDIVYYFFMYLWSKILNIVLGDVWLHYELYSLKYMKNGGGNSWQY